MDNENIIREFIEAWSLLDPEELTSYFAEDGVYHNMPTGPAGGRDNVKKMIAGFTDPVGGDPLGDPQSRLVGRHRDRPQGAPKNHSGS